MDFFFLKTFGIVLYLNVLLRSDKNKKLENDFVFNKSFDIIVCSPQGGEIDDQK